MSNEAELKDLLFEGAKKFSVNLSDSQVSRFMSYKAILKEWNEKINLTAIEEDKDVIIKHFIDSLSIIPFIKAPDASIIDIGTGAGFPGIPIKIAAENINVVLLDSLDKRVKFLNEVISKIGLKGINAIHSRAEDYGSKHENRERFDYATARAVASLPVLLEYCLPFVKPGGLFIAMKGSSIEEVEQSKKALEVLGARIEEVVDIELPFSDIKRNIISVRKLRQTPTKYPRKAGKPSKEPLI